MCKLTMSTTKSTIGMSTSFQTRYCPTISISIELTVFLPLTMRSYIFTEHFQST